VKMNGNNRRKLFVKIVRHSEVSINEFYLFSFFVLESFLLLGVVRLLVNLVLYYFVVGSAHTLISQM